MLKRALLVLAVPLALWGADRWWSHVLFLADDKLEGRNTGTAGYRKAAEYVAGEWERAGLRPAGTSGYFQAVKFRSRTIVEEQSSLALGQDGKWEALRLGEEANFSLRTEPPERVEAAIVFAGYALTVPEYQHDDLAGLDLRGKLVLYLSGGPSAIPGAVRSHYQSAEERSKNLEKAGAIGTLQILNPKAMDVPWERSTLARFQPSMSLTDPALLETRGRRLSVTVNPSRTERFFAGSGHSFQEILELSNAGKALPRFPLPLRLKTQARFEAQDLECRNVAGIRPGADPKLRDEYVVLTAHLDHLGVGRPIRADTINNSSRPACPRWLLRWGMRRGRRRRPRRGRG